MTRDDVLAEYTGCGWDYPEYENMADEIVRLRGVVAALREPSEGVLLAALKSIPQCRSSESDVIDGIRAAVAAAEQEVAGE